MINNFLFQRKSCHRLSHGSCSPSQSSLSNIGQSSILTLFFFFYFNFLWSSLNMFSCSIAIHMAQPWFHSKLSRDEAHKLITQHGLIDGYCFFHVIISIQLLSISVYSLYLFYILLHNFKFKDVIFYVVYIQSFPLKGQPKQPQDLCPVPVSCTENQTLSDSPCKFCFNFRYVQIYS